MSIIETVNVTIRMDKDLKAQAEALFADLGLNMTTAITMFTKQAAREQGIPFSVTKLPNVEPRPDRKIFNVVDTGSCLG